MCVVSMVTQWAIDQPKRVWEESPHFVRQLEKLHDLAKQYDVDNDQPDCELDDKRKALKKLADELDIKIKFLEAA